jgi:release factor glutamine methyltransferase
VFAEEEAALLSADATDPDDLERMVAQRVAGLPLEHVLGWAEFAGRRVLVDPGVFVPRPRTEFLVAQARLAVTSGCIVVDLCCGSGAIGVAVAHGTSAELYATDADPVAVANARRNVEPIGGRVFAGDLYDGLPRELQGRVDIVTVIAPYVPTEAIALLPHEARDFEPLTALDGGADGLDVLRRIIAEAPEWLAPEGSLFTEISEGQAPTVVELIESAGLTARLVSDDDAWVAIATR